MICYFDPLMRNRMKDLKEEGCSLIWGGAALSDSVQQWVAAPHSRSGMLAHRLAPAA